MNASPTRSPRGISPRGSSAPSTTSETACTMTATVPNGAYQFSADPWFNPPSVIYATTTTSTHYLDCAGCDLMVANPIDNPRYPITFEGTITMPTSYSHEYLCELPHPTGYYPPDWVSTIPDPDMTTTSEISRVTVTRTVTDTTTTPDIPRVTVTQTVTQRAAPGRVPRGLGRGVSSSGQSRRAPTCTTTIEIYVRRPTYNPNPTKTVYARTKTVDEIVDCNWCVLQLETRYAGKSMVVSVCQSPGPK